MKRKNLWWRVVESSSRLNFFRHAVAAAFGLFLLPFLLYYFVAPAESPMKYKATVRGVIESARVAPCLDRLRKTTFSARGCVDGSAVTYRDESGLMHTAVFHLPDYPPFDSSLYPRGGVLDLIMFEDSVNSGFNQRVDAVAVNGVVLKPMYKEGGLGERLGVIAFALLMALMVATFIGRLMLDFKDRAKAKAEAQSKA